jgi:hypothetical protein
MAVVLAIALLMEPVGCDPNFRAGLRSLGYEAGSCSPRRAEVDCQPYQFNNCIPDHFKTKESKQCAHRFVLFA